MKKILGLEVSKTTVRAVEAGKKGNDVFVTALGEFNFSASLFKKKDVKSVAKAFKKFLALHKIEARTCCMSLYSSETCFQESTIPENLSKLEMDELVKGNLERLFSFKEEKYLYAYNNHDLKHKPGRKRILYAGINKDLADFYLALLNECDIVLEVMDIAPFSLLTVFYLVKKKNEQHQVVVYLRENTSYVIAHTDNTCRLLYVINRGLKELREEVPGSFEGAGEEFRRTFKFYETEYKTRISEVFLLGGKKDLTPIAESLTSYLGYKIRPYTDYQKIVSFDPKIKEKYTEEYFNPIAVVSMSLLHKGHDFDIRKLWNRRYSVRTLYKYINFSIILLVGIILVSIMPYIYFKIKSRWLLDKRNELQDNVKVLQNKVQGLREQKDKISDFNEEVKLQGVYISQINSLSWAEIFDEIIKALPPKCWLDSFYLTDKGIVEVGGQSEDLYYLTEFVGSLYESPYIDNIKFSSMKELTRGGVSFQLQMEAK